jgi:hypothetical protein
MKDYDNSIPRAKRTTPSPIYDMSSDASEDGSGYKALEIPFRRRRQEVLWLSKADEAFASQLKETAPQRP